MSDAHSASFSHNIFRPDRRFFTGWRVILASGWLLLALVGAGNLFMRAGSMHLAALSPATLAVGPALALQYMATSSQDIIPAHLAIPSIGVDAEVEHVGRASDGSMQTPSSFTTVGWYENGSAPGQPGNAVIDGHVNNALTSAGVFEHLDQLQLGDSITVSDSSGKSLTFRVFSEQVYAVAHAPLSQIFTVSGPPGLALITCDGAWDQGKKEFNERLVIYASLVQ